MQLVIDISEDDYRKAQDGRASVSMMRKAIGNGTPLPKGPAFPLFEDGSYAPMASKDMKDWVMCIGAFVDGDPVDLLEFVKQIQEMVEKGGET